MKSESKKTASRCITETDTGTHTFEIVGYTLKKGIGIGKFVRSTTFAVGGFDWAIRFYPDGAAESSKDYVTAFLVLLSKNAEVNALYDIRFVRQLPPMQITGATTTPQVIRMHMMMKNQMTESTARRPQGPRLFKSSDDTRFGSHRSAHILRSQLEQNTMMLGLGYIHDDRLTIECDLTVIIGESQIKSVESEIEVPPCDMMDHFGKLFTQKEGADITFTVAGHTIEAHKIVLAARSPVFRAQFYGQMSESGTHNVTIEEMQPAVFRVLLHFIYCDSLPDLSDLEDNDYGEMMRHLLVAADRYAMARLKLMCQSIIRKNLNADNVSTTLALADQHHCDGLKAACIEFIIASSENLDAVKATQGYANLKRTYPSAFVELFEETSTKLQRRKTSSSSSF